MGGVLSGEYHEANEITNRDRQLLNAIYANNNNILPVDFDVFLINKVRQSSINYNRTTKIKENESI
jgi:hypothetical protein